MSSSVSASLVQACYSCLLQALRSRCRRHGLDQLSQLVLGERVICIPMPLEVRGLVLELCCPGCRLLLSWSGALLQQPTFHIFKLLIKRLAGLLQLGDVQAHKLVVQKL